MHAALDEVALERDGLRGAPQRHVRAPLDLRTRAAILHAHAVRLEEARVAHEFRVVLGGQPVLVVSERALDQRAPVGERELDLERDPVGGLRHFDRSISTTRASQPNSR